MKWPKKELSAAILLVLLALALRLPGVGSSMTVDEFNWMDRSQTFWHQLFREGDLSGTFLSSHPGATVMWLAGSGIFWQEQRLGFDMSVESLKHFRRYATAPIAIAASFLIGLTAWQSMKLFGYGIGTIAGVLLAFDPYLAGMQRVVHPDALLGLFMLVAVLAALQYRHTPRRGRLVLVGIASGLALVTKLMPALWLGPIGFVLALAPEGTWSWKHIQWVPGLKALGIVLVVAVATAMVVWPAMLTKADFQLGYITRDASKVAQVEHVALEAADEDAIHPLSFYVRTFLGRVPLHVQVLALGAIVISLWLAKGSSIDRQMLWLSVYALGFFLLVTFIAKKADRYGVPFLVVVPLLAAWTAVQFWRVRALVHSRMLRIGVGLVAFVLIVGSFMQAVPHAIAYNNPLFPDVRALSQQGWGEGLEIAAAWINQQPGAKDVFVASWYPSVLRTYFVGRTMGLSSREDSRVRYVVTYRNMGGRAPDTQASDVLDEYVDQEPVHVVSLHGLPYVHVYEREVYEQIVGEMLPGVVVGQDIEVVGEIATVEALVATYSGRAVQGTLRMTLKDADSGVLLATSSRLVASFVDDEWAQFDLTEPIRADGPIRVEFEAIGTSAKNAPTIRYSRLFDYRPGEFLRSDRGVLSDVDVKQGDLAVRVDTSAAE